MSPELRTIAELSWQMNQQKKENNALKKQKNPEEETKGDFSPEEKFIHNFRTSKCKNQPCKNGDLCPFYHNDSERRIAG